MYAGKVGKRFAILSLQPFLVFGLGRIFDVFIGAVMWIWQIMEAVKDVKEYNQNLGEDEESEDVVWVCESCGKQFDSKKECSDHEKECGWACDRCGRTFKTKKIAEKHEKSCKK